MTLDPKVCCDWCRRVNRGDIPIICNPNYNCLPCESSSEEPITCSKPKCQKTFCGRVFTGHGRSACPHCFYDENNLDLQPGQRKSLKSRNRSEILPGQRKLSEAPAQRKYNGTDETLLERAYKLVPLFMADRRMHPEEPPSLMKDKIRFRLEAYACECVFRWQEDMSSTPIRTREGDVLEGFDAFCWKRYRQELYDRLPRQPKEKSNPAAGSERERYEKRVRREIYNRQPKAKTKVEGFHYDEEERAYLGEETWRQTVKNAPRQDYDHKGLEIVLPKKPFRNRVAGLRLHLCLDKARVLSTELFSDRGTKPLTFEEIAKHVGRSVSYVREEYWEWVAEVIDRNGLLSKVEPNSRLEKWIQKVRDASR